MKEVNLSVTFTTKGRHTCEVDIKRFVFKLNTNKGIDDIYSFLLMLKCHQEWKILDADLFVREV